jgi:internalin A
MTRSELLAIIGKAKRSGQRKINLSGNGIKELPPQIGQLTNLTSLDLRNNSLTALPESIGELSNLISLDLRNNSLTTLPNSIGQLTNLTSLGLKNNSLTTLPNSIGQLTNFTSLDLSSNQLMALPESIGELSNLISLDLRNNSLTTLPNSIGQLTNLTSLGLKNNSLTTLPNSIGQLTNFTSLDLSSNRLTMLPEAIVQLTNLMSLNLSYNQLTALPDSIVQLTNLTSLSLWHNLLTALPDSIAQFTNFTSLNLSSNRLTTLPDSIAQFTNFTSLNLSSNRLTTLPVAIIQLTNLTSLNLRFNQLATLPEAIGKLTKLQNLDLDGNPLSGIPPEVIKKGGLAVRDYYRQRLEAETDYIYEAKLIVIGEGGSGKTSLANKLIDSNYTLKLEGTDTPEKSTEGIDVLRLDFPHPSGNPFRINIWDFGGQEIYHATHQFFLTKRSLYLLVADTRQDNTDFNYWLEVVELLTEGSPTLIIKNEKQDRSCQINENQLHGRFPNQLKEILPTNLADNRGLSKIITVVQNRISELDHIGDPLPKTWVKVRKALETENRNYISQDEFLRLCNTHGFKRREDKLQLGGYLHDLGVCLHFQEDSILKNYVILKPEWGTTAVYKVLDTPKVQKNLGRFTHTDLAEIWADDQYADMRDELLQLMMKFKLCYEIPHRSRTYIAPQLLSPNQPEYDWNNTDNLILRYHYDFMPKGMLTRFIVEMHRLIDGELVWKDGVILKDNNAQAEVIEARYRNEINIRISGKIKKSLLENIRHEFKKIHDSYERLKYQEYIPCNCDTCKGSQTPFSYSLNRLQERLKNDRHEIECDISYTMVDVRELIDDVVNVDTRYSKIGNPPSNLEANNLERRLQLNQEGIHHHYYSEKPKDMANIYQKHSGSGDNVAGDKIGTQINNSQSLAQAAQDIKELLDQLTIDYPNDDTYTQAGRAIGAIKNSPTLKQRIGKAIKESGTTAVEKAIEAVTDNPIAGVIIAGVKGFIDA